MHCEGGWNGVQSSPKSNIVSEENQRSQSQNLITKTPDHKNISPTKYEHKFYNQTKPVESDDDSDWDSPPLSENNVARVVVDKSPVSAVKGQSNSAFSSKQSNLMSPNSSWDSSKHPNSMSNKQPSPSLHKAKDALFDDGVFTRNENDDTNKQEFSSLPPNSLKEEEKHSQPLNCSR